MANLEKRKKARKPIRELWVLYRPSPIPEELEDFLPGFGPTPAEWPPLLMRHIVGGRPTTPEPSPLPPPTTSPLHTPCLSSLYRPSPESPQFDDYLPGFSPTPEPWPPLHIAHGREAAPSPSPSRTPACSPPPSPRKSQNAKSKKRSWRMEKSRTSPSLCRF